MCNTYARFLGILAPSDHILLQTCKNRSHVYVKGLTRSWGPLEYARVIRGAGVTPLKSKNKKNIEGATIDHTYERGYQPLVYVQSNGTTYGLNDNKMCATYLSVNLNFLSLDSNYLTCLE